MSGYDLYCLFFSADCVVVNGTKAHRTKLINWIDDNSSAGNRVMLLSYSDDDGISNRHYLSQFSFDNPFIHEDGKTISLIDADGCYVDIQLLKMLSFI